MKNAIVKLGFCLLFFCLAQTVYATPPSVQIDRVTSTPTNLTTVNFLVKFSAPVTGFDKNDVALSGAAAAGLTSSANVTVVPNVSPGTAGWYDVSVTGLTTEGTLTLSIAANAANEAAAPNDPNTASTGGTPSIVFDKTKPTPTITQPAPQNDPTQGESQVRFVVTWSEAVASFPTAAVDLSGSGAGLGTLTINAINEIAPNNGTKFEVLIDIPNTATGGLHVIMTIPAGGVSDLAGNTNNVDSPTGRDNDIVYAGLVPTIESPPTAVGLEGGFKISGKVLTDGGVVGVTRGFVYKSSSPVSGTDNKTQVGTGTGTFTSSAVTGLSYATRYYYRTYADNGVGGIQLSSEQSVYTLSQSPAANATISAAASGSKQIDLTFTKFASITRAKGYVILRKEGSAPVDTDLADGKTPVVGNMPLLIDVITDDQRTMYSDQDVNLVPGKVYYYAVVPFNWDSATPNPVTYNYLEGFTTANARTFSKSSYIAFTSASATLDYAQKTGTITTASDGISIASLTLYDGNGTLDDDDNLATELKSLTIHVDNWTMVKEIAINDAGTIHAKGVLDASGNITFNLGTNLIISNDNNMGTGSPDQFNIIASFNAANVTDGAVIKLTVTGATTYATGTTTGSEFAAADAGGANTGGSNNAIQVIPTKFVYSGVPTGLNSNVLWGFTATLKDNNNVVATNFGGTVTVSEPSLDPPITSASEITKPVVSGVVTFTALKFGDAGSKAVNLDASNWTGTNNGTLNITVNSLGVSITGPGVPTGTPQKFCFNDASTAPATFDLLNDITITESDKTDFAAGANQTFSLMLPAGFIFDVTVTNPTFTKTGTELAGVPVVDGYVGNNIVRIKYSVNTAAATGDGFTIKGLKVKYTGTTPITGADILRVGGSAIQTKNSDADAKSHGKLSAENGATAVDFVVTTAGFTTGETRFSKSYTGLISLKGTKVVGGADAPGVFSGTGIALDGDGTYKFNPSQLAPGSYTITFTYTDTSSPFCKSTATKQFEVYTTIINGLNASYCIYDAKSTLNGPSTFNGGGYYYDYGLGLYLYNPALYTQYAATADPYVWYDPTYGWRTIVATSPGVYEFNPSDPIYSYSLAYWPGFVYVGYRKYNTAYNYDEYVYQQIFVYQRPTINFTPTFADGICATDGPVILQSPQFDADHSYDDFWSSVPGNPGSAMAGITVNGSKVYTFTPSSANPGPSTSNVSVQINYKHQDFFTKCTNQIAQVVSVWRKPPQVPTALIEIKGAANDTSGEFCQVGDPVSAFSINPPDATMFYRWYDAPATSEVTTAGKTSFNAVSNIPTTGGIPNVGVYTFNITQTEHRTANFAGCESVVRPLTVEVFAPTLISAGTPTTICEGNNVILNDLGASITPPSSTLDGTWTSMHPTNPGTFNVTNRFPSLTASYTPSAQEIAEGQLTLRLRSDDPPGPCGYVEAFVTIRINPGITVTFPVSPVQYCASAKDMLIEGKVSSSTLGFHWSVTDGTGVIDPLDAVKTTTRYTPSFTEANEGANVELTLTTDDPDGPGGPCGIVTGTVHMLISQRPQVVVGVPYEICADQTINLTSRIPPTGNTTGDLTKSSASSVTWTTNGLGTITNPTALTTTYDISGAAAASERDNTTTITFTATSNTPGGSNICPAESASYSITLHPRPLAPTPINPPNYCVGDVVDLLRVGGTFPSWYNNIDLAPTHLISSGNNELSTAVVANAEKRVPFWVTQTTDKSLSFAGCESPSVKMTVVVNPLPAPAFTFVNQCLGDIMQFTNGSTLAQPVDPMEPARSILNYQWNFDDGLGNTDAGNGPIPASGNQDGRTTGTYENPGHQFKNTGNYNVRLTAFTSDGCSATLTHTPIEVGPIPVANFAVARLCNEDDTEFTSSNGLDASVHATYAWDFSDASSGGNNVSAVKNPKHKFTGVATYNVQLTVTTDLQCSNSIAKNVSIFPYVKSFPYVENFESPNHGWVPDGKVINGSNITVQTSWNLLTSAGSITADPAVAAGPRFWATHTNVSADTYYYNNERSVLYGPCVDMTSLDRPVLAMDYFNDTEDKGDGVYVEYIDENDPSGVWTRLGDNISGLRWYNQSSIGGLSLLGDVGQNLSQYGWSGSTPEWTTGRYNLDAFANKSRLRFRIVFGSNFSPVNTDIFDGFAFDYFKLESRNRVVLVENFTSNSTSAAVGGNRTAFKAFPSAASSSEVVKIEYHTGLPAQTNDPQDPIFAQNPMDPNARASYYGLSAVPRGYIDGYSNLDGAGMFGNASGVITSWAANYYSTESLKTSPIAITVNTPTITNGVLNITGTVAAVETDLLANRYSLYIAVVEETVGNDAFVLRKMLPSASGIKVPSTSKGQSFTFDQSWSIDRSYLGDNPKLIAVAFVQSDIVNLDKERPVLQAAYNDNVPEINYTTGIEIPRLQQTALYPNPADRMATIELPEATKSGVEVDVMDQLGRSVIKSSIGIGQRSTSVNTTDLSGGVYIIQLRENGALTTKKLLITHSHR